MIRQHVNDPCATNDPVAAPAVDSSSPTVDYNPPAVVEEPEADSIGAWSEFLAGRFLEPIGEQGVIGRFDGWPIERMLGQGGMAVVLQAIDPKLGRSVALKIMRPSLAAVAKARRRFVREAQIAAQLAHDNIVTVHNVIDEHPLPYLVLELVEGPTLAEKIKADGPLSLDQLFRIGVEIAQALKAAHARGLIHRDLKPANIKLQAQSGRTIVMDFGLARGVSSDEITEFGARAGTPSFMSPEQARGETLDGASDIFSFGTVLYSAATGKCPFEGESALDICDKVIFEEPTDVRELRPDLPPALAAIIRKLMTKDRKRRYATVDEVLADLAAVRPNLAPNRPARKRALAIIFAASLLAGASVFGGIVIRITGDGKVREVTINPGERLELVVQNDNNQPVLHLQAAQRGGDSSKSASDFSRWQLPEGARPTIFRREGSSVVLSNDDPLPDHHWVMVRSPFFAVPANAHYLVFSIDEVGGVPDAGWYVKLIAEQVQGGEWLAAREHELTGGKETGNFAIQLPEAIRAGDQSWAIEMFSTGRRGAKLRFSNVRITPDITAATKLLTHVPPVRTEPPPAEIAVKKAK